MGRLAAVAVLCACRGRQAPPPVPPPADTLAPLVDPRLELLVTPSEDHAPFVRAIDAAKSSIEMTMFHLTDPVVIDALVRAKARGVDVQIILDGKQKNDKAIDKLAAGGIDAQKSSPAFSITHAKTMIVDRELAFVTAINLTQDVQRTRDLGVVTHDKDVVAALDELFDVDRHNARTGGNDTPRPYVASLVISPSQSRKKLEAVIASAKHDLRITVENLGDQDIEHELGAAAARGVKVQVIVPLCDKNPNPLYDLPAARALVTAGVDARVMPAPESPQTPYMHSKMILADGEVAYVGSVNFSANSTTHAREIGIVFRSAAIGAQIRGIFDADWAVSIPPPDGEPSCSP